MQFNDEPSAFVLGLKNLDKEGKLTLALTKLLARENLKPSANPLEMIKELCDFDEYAAEAQRGIGLLDPLTALQRLVEIQVDGSLKSADRLNLLSDGIGKSRGVHLAVRLARSEDSAEHSYSQARGSENKDIGPHLERRDVEKLNAIAAERLEAAVRAGELKFTRAWIDSVEWYLFFMGERVRREPGLLLAEAAGIAVVLTVIINNQSAEQYNPKHRNGHYAQQPMFLAKQCFGFEAIDQAISTHEIQLRNLGESIANRIDIYRDMREHFSQLADPQPGVAESAGARGV
jgi:hypothetical protein